MSCFYNNNSININNNNNNMYITIVHCVIYFYNTLHTKIVSYFYILY